MPATPSNNYHYVSILDIVRHDKSTRIAGPDRGRPEGTKCGSLQSAATQKCAGICLQGDVLPERGLCRRVLQCALRSGADGCGAIVK